MPRFDNELSDLSPFLSSELSQEKLTIKVISKKKEMKCECILIKHVKKHENKPW